MEDRDDWRAGEGGLNLLADRDPFAAVVQATRTPMSITDPRQGDNPIIFVNAAFCELTGYAREEAVGRNCRFLQGEGTDREVVRSIRQAIEARQPITAELLNFRKDGSSFRNALHISPVFGEAGGIQYFFASMLDVTNQALAAESLKRREAELRLIIEGASDYAILTTDVEGRVTSWSAGAEKAFGWTAEEMIGRPSDLTFTPADRARDQPGRELSTARREGCADDERWHQRKDGGQVFMSGATRPLPHDERGRERGFIKIARDETERRETQQRLSQSEERLRLATEAAEVGFWDVDVVGDRLIWPARVKAMFGISPDAPVTLQDFFEQLHPDDRDATTQAFLAASDPASRALYDVEYRTIGKEDGLVRWVAAKGRGLFDGQGRCVRVIGTAIDITRRKRDEARLRMLNEQLEAEVAARTGERNQLWALSRDIMLRCRPDGEILTVNPAWGEALGWREEELVGTSLLTLLHADDVERTREAMRSHGEGGSNAGFENRYRRRGGDYRWISWSTTAADGLILAVGRDITTEKEAAEALARTEDALRQAQKMEAIGQLTGGLAHDFNNLLAGISGSLEMMNARLGQGRLQDLEKYIIVAQGAAKRAAALTHRLLAFARRQTLLPRPTDANQLIADMLELIGRSVGPGIVVEHAAAPDLWTVLVDAPQLENALLNLCINARDAMPGGGRLTIETANHWIDRGAGNELNLPEGAFVSIRVRDTGVGMAPEVINKAFDPFFTTKPVGEGTGLGLSMVYGFAKQSGGQVRIVSEVGRGTGVCLYLPRHAGGAEIETTSDRLEAAAPAGSGETVLVVDDEPTVRLLVADVLEELGYICLEADDSAAGLRLLQSDARIDLLITDVGLPGGMNGREMFDAARVSRPGLKVLFITGFAQTALLDGGELGPGMAALTKPFAMNVIAARIRELVAAPA